MESAQSMKYDKVAIEFDLTVTGGANKTRTRDSDRALK